MQARCPAPAWEPAGGCGIIAGMSRLRRSSRPGRRGACPRAGRKARPGTSRRHERRTERPQRPPKPSHTPKPSAKPPAKPPGEPPGEPSPEGERLQKVLAAAGLGSRRQCEELILTGRVDVDRQAVLELGTRVDPSSQEIRVDGEPLPRTRLVHYAVHKPPGVVSTSRDPAGRPRVIDLVPGEHGRLYAVGRLDLTSEGLILVTNDGELANRLTHPRYGVEKTYRVQVAGHPEPQVLRQLCHGVRLAEGVTRAESVKVKSHHKASTYLEIVLREGRNREIRRMLAKTGHKVLKLVRIAVGPVRLAKLPPGAARKLTSAELKALRRAAGKPGRPPSRTSQKRNRR
jgi:23S rRNA pseudouridine2605 synthase